MIGSMISVPVRVAFAAAFVVISGCHPASGIRQTTSEASSETVPEWIGGLTDGFCPAGNECFTGISRCAADPVSALDAARISGYARIAERAFPIEISGVWKDARTIDLEGGRESSKTAISETTRAELAGRIQGARVVDQYWSKRRVHSLDGVRDCHDGWVLVAISADRLESLHAAEMEIAAKELAEVGSRVETIKNAFAAGPSRETLRDAAAFIARGGRVCGTSAVDTPGRAAVCEKVGTLASAFAGAAEFRIDRDIRPDGFLSAELPLSVKVAGAPVAGLELVVSGCGRGADETVSSSDDGSAPIRVRFDNPFSSCRLSVFIPGFDSQVAAVSVAPPYSGISFDQNVQFDGYAPSGLLKWTQSRIVEVGNRLAAGHRSSDGRILATKATVLIDLHKPVPYNGRAMICSGSVEVSIVAVSAGTEMFRYSSGRLPVRVLGLDEGQLSSALRGELAKILGDAADSVARSWKLNPAAR